MNDGVGIIWGDFAKIEVKTIYSFLKKEATKEVAKKVIDCITQEVKILANQPFLGPIEKELTNRERAFRCLIYRKYKIIYWINPDQNQIEIWDVFDSRQEPLKIKRTK